MRNNYRQKAETTKEKVLKILKIVFTVIFWTLFAALLLSATASFFKKDEQLNIFGKYFVAILSDSMETELPTGCLIINDVPPPEEDLKVGDIITYRSKEESAVLITHRITAIIVNNETFEVAYRTKGDNAPSPDSYLVFYNDIVGVYSGKSVNTFGYIFSFLSSYYGVICLLLVFGAIAVTMYINENITFVEYKNTLRKDVVAISYGILEVLKDRDIATPDEVLDLQQVIMLLGNEPETKKECESYGRRLKVFTERYAAHQYESQYYINDNIIDSYEKYKAEEDEVHSK